MSSRKIAIVALLAAAVHRHLLLLLSCSNLRRRKKRKRGHIGGVTGRPRKEARNFGSEVWRRSGLKFTDYHASLQTPEEKFQKLFRIPRRLLAQLVHDLDADLRPKTRARPDSVMTQERIMVSLYMLGSEGFGTKTVSELTGFGESTLRDSLDKFCEAMVAKYYTSVIRWFTDASDLRKATDWYMEHRSTPGQCAALDGKHFCARACGDDESSLKDWHGTLSLNVLGAVREKYLFCWLHSRHSISSLLLFVRSSTRAK